MMNSLQQTSLAAVAGRWSRRLGAALLLATAGAGAAQAQVASYQFSQSTGTYTPITGGTVLGNIRSDDEQYNNPAVPQGTTQAGDGPGFPVGFTFQFGGVACDRFAVNNNGWLSLGNSSGGAAAVTARLATPSILPFQNTDPGLANVLAAFNRDLVGQPGSELRFATLGTAPARTLVVQWSGYGIYQSLGAVVNFQIRLDERGNTVSMAYGAMSLAGGSAPVQVGLRGASNADYHLRTSTSSWTATTVGTSPSDAIAFSSTVLPPSGLRYVFTPQACATPSNVAVSGISQTAASVTFAPAAGIGSYTVTLTPQGGSPVVVTSTATGSPVALSGLAGGTAYAVQVASNCSPGVTAASSPVSFNTPSSNDNCASAVALPVGNTTCTYVVGSNLGATASGTGTGVPAPTCGGTNGRDVWYTVVVPASGGVVVATSMLPGSNTTDTVLELYAGTCSSLASLGCNDNNSFDNFAVAAVRNRTPGEVIYVRAWTSGSTTGTFNICTTSIRPNDDPTGAIALPVGVSCTPVSGTNFNATVTTPNGYPNPGSCGIAVSPKDVWYRFQTAASGAGSQALRIEVTGNPAGLVRVFSAASSAGPFTQIGCGAGTTNNTVASAVDFNNLTPRTTYYVSVAGYGSGDIQGDFTICATVTASASRSALANGQVEVYPNPASRSATLRLPALGSVRTAQVSLFNALGQVVRTQAVPAAATATEAVLPLAGLPAGLYTVRVQAGAETAVLRLAVE